jgi:hypothetical protein
MRTDLAGAWNTALPAGAFEPRNKDLCWNKTDAPTLPTTWHNANQQCPAPWRLPNLAELKGLYDAMGQGGVSRIDFSLLTSPNSNPGGATSLHSGTYWSSTQNGTGMVYYLYNVNGNRGVTSGSQVNYTRCVREL